jgi:rhodanese-related sulfurtransferase
LLRQRNTYCSSGYRGNIAADELNKIGFDAVTMEAILLGKNM